MSMVTWRGIDSYSHEKVNFSVKTDYKISDDGKTLSYGKMKISLE